MQRKISCRSFFYSCTWTQHWVWGSLRPPSFIVKWGSWLHSMEVKFGLVYISRFVLKYLGMQYCGPAHILHVGPPCTYTMHTTFSHLHLLLVSYTRIKRWMSWLLTGDESDSDYSCVRQHWSRANEARRETGEWLITRLPEKETNLPARSWRSPFTYIGDCLWMGSWKVSSTLAICSATGKHYLKLPSRLLCWSTMYALVQ